MLLAAAWAHGAFACEELFEDYFGQLRRASFARLLTHGGGGRGLYESEKLKSQELQRLRRSEETLKASELPEPLESR